MNTIRIKPGISIQETLDNAPFGAITLILSSGRYEEKVEINRKDVRIIGEDYPEIYFSDHHGTERDGKVFGTGDSATFTIAAPGFEAIGVKFSNNFDYPYWHQYKLDNPDKTIDTQAVAIRTVIGATRSVFTDCIFSSWQDTVYADVGIHYFNNCTIIGNVDFIFGSGEALFENCEIISIGEGFVSAPSTFTSRKIGFIFQNCNIKGKNIENDSVFLARPWHPSGSINRTPMAIFSNCNLGPHIKKEYWTGMNSKTPEGVMRYWLPEESRFSIEDDISTLLDEFYKDLQQP